MGNVMNDKDLHKFFIENKVDVQDEGFSERIFRQLPERRNILPHIIMVVFIVIGLIITFSIQGANTIIDQINNLISSVNHSPGLFITSVVLLGIVAIIGYSLMQVEES